MKLNFSRGFTLTELLLVIAIIGALAGIILASITKAREKAQIAKTVIEVKELSKVFINTILIRVFILFAEVHVMLRQTLF